MPASPTSPTYGGRTQDHRAKRMTASQVNRPKKKRPSASKTMRKAVKKRGYK